jgi:hypothetical protein
MFRTHFAGALNKADIVEIKAMKKPPPAMTMVIEAVCILMGKKPARVEGDRPGVKVLFRSWLLQSGIFVSVFFTTLFVSL